MRAGHDPHEQADDGAAQQEGGDGDGHDGVEGGEGHRGQVASVRQILPVS